MSVSVDPFRFDPPGPAGNATTQEKINWPKTYIPIVSLADYILSHEAAGCVWDCNTLLYNGHNTTVHFAWFNYDTGEALGTYTSTVPDPGDHGWTYWSRYRVWSWMQYALDELYYPMTLLCEVSWSSDTLPDEKRIKFWNISSPHTPPDEVICTPGEKRCFGNDLYECSADGKSWNLFEAGAGICTTPSACPDFWRYPVGAVVCWILTIFEGLLGLVTGGFLTLQLNVKNFLDNFSTQISSFLNDIKGSIEDAIGGIVATISDVSSAIADALGDVWAGIVDNVTNLISSAITTLDTALRTLVTSVQDALQNAIDTMQTTLQNALNSAVDTFNNIISGVQDALSNAITSLTDFINNSISTVIDTLTNIINGVQDALQSAIDTVSSTLTGLIASVQTALQNSIMAVSDALTSGIEDVTGFINTQISNMQDWVTDFVPDLVSGMFEWAKPVIDPIINAADWLKNISDVFTGTFKDSEEYKQNLKDTQDKQQEIQDIITKWS